MDRIAVIRIFLLFILLALSAFFSSAETALTTVNVLRMKKLADEGDTRAAVVLKILDKPKDMLSAILIGNNIVNIYASSLATELTLKLLGNTFISFTTGILTLMVLIFGEITPKTMATSSAEKIALWYSRVLYYLIKIFKPLVFAIDLLSGIILKLFGYDESNKKTITEEELRDIVNYGHEEGIIQKESKTIINNVFDFGDTVVKDIMVPRIDIVFINVDSDYDTLLEVFRKEQYTRIPVFENNIDNIIGIINIKDLLLNDDREHFNIRNYLRTPLYTYEFKKVSDLLLEMKRTYSNLVIVLDEYGQTCGLVSLEDMLEEIVGEIRDEYDTDEAQDIIRLSENEYLVAGFVHLDILNERLGCQLYSEDYDTIGGFVMGSLEEFPKEGDEIEAGGLHIRVEKMDKVRVERVYIKSLG